MRRIAICYAFHGSGHHAAALAVEAALREADPACSVELVDFFRCLYPRGGGAIESFYLGLLKAAPFLWDVLYDGRMAGAMAAGWRLSGRLRVRRFYGRLATLRPDAVICTQASPFLFLNSGSHADLPPVYGVVTDFVPNRLWAGSGKGMVMVPTDDAARRLRAHGVPAERIRVCGIPIRIGELPPRPVRASPDERVVLMMGGGFGLHLSVEAVRSIDASPERFSLQVVTGRNEPFRKRLEAARASFRHPIAIEGYVNDVPARMRAAEVLVSKPGGMTTAEALALGVPMVMLPPLPGQEMNNRNFLMAAGAALAAAPDRVGEPVTRILSDPALSASMREKMAVLARPRAAQEIVRLVLDACT